MRRVAPLFLMLFAAACAQEGTYIPPAADGLPIIRMAGAALAAAPLLVLTETISIDGDEHGLSRLAGIAVSGSKVVALDQTLSEIFVFHRSGALLHRFGRSGAGPGELKMPTRIAVSGDTIIVLDQIGLTLFDVSGRFLEKKALNTAAAGGIAGFRPSPQSLVRTTRGFITTFRHGGLGPQNDTSADSTAFHALSVDGVISPPFCIFRRPECR